MFAPSSQSSSHARFRGGPPSSSSRRRRNRSLSTKCLAALLFFFGATGFISARASQFCPPRSEHFTYERQSTPCVQSHTLFGPPSPSPPNRLPHLGVIASFLPHFYVFRSVIVSWPAVWSNTAASCANLRIKVTAFPRTAFSESGLCARVLCLCVCARASW